MAQNKFSYKSTPILTLVNDYKRKILNLTPDYQRKYIWKDEFKDELILSILSKYPIGNILINKINDDNHGDFPIEEILDGQQRFRTILDFIEGSYKVRNKERFKQIIEITESYVDKYKRIISEEELQNYETMKKRNRIEFSLLPKIIQDDFSSYNLNITELLSFSKKEVTKYFKYVQNQERLKAGEIINAMASNNDALNDIFENIKDKSKFLSLVNFKNDRLSFDKFFVNIIGLFEGKLNLNNSEPEIIKFSSKEDNFLKKNDHVDLMIKNINFITDSVEDEFNFAFLKAGALKEILLFLSFYDLEKEKITFPELLKMLNHVQNNKPLYQDVVFIESGSWNLKDAEKSIRTLHSIIKSKDLRNA